MLFNNKDIFKHMLWITCIMYGYYRAYV